MTSNHESDRIPHLTPDDDERVPMTMGERTTWVYGVLVIVATAVYFVIVLSQLGETPVAEVAWQVPMLVTIGAVIVGTVLGTVASAIVAAITTRDLRQESDIRDTEIGHFGERANVAVIGIGIAVILALSMLELDPFWIGSATLAVGAIGATAANVAKIRAYRRSFHG